MMRKFFLAAALLTLSTTLFGNGAFGTVRSLGMAGANIAWAKDAGSVYYNPANAVFICDQFDGGIAYRYEDKHLDLDDQRIVPKKHHTFFVDGGFNYRFGCCQEWGLNFALVNFEELSTNYQQNVDFFGFPGDPTFTRFDYRTDVVSANLSYRINCCLAVGAGVDFYVGRLKVDGLQSVANRSVDSRFVSDNGSDYSWGTGVTVGATFCKNGLRAGFAYSPRTHMRKYDLYEGLCPLGRIDIPALLRLGVAYQVNPCWVVAVDYEYRWLQAVRTFQDPWFPVGESIFFLPNLLGSTAGPCFGWHDYWIFKVGTEYIVTQCLTLRAGWRHRRSPIREGETLGTLNVLTLDVVEDWLSAGATYRISCCQELSAYVEYGFPKHKRSNVVDMSGASTTQGPPLVFSGNQFSVGIAVTQRF